MNFISEDFQVQYLPYYKLVVKAGHQEDTLLVQDTDQRIVALMQYPPHSPTSNATKLLSLPFRQTVVTIPHQSLTFIPNDVYHKGDQDLYADFLENKHEGEVEVEELGNMDIKAIYQYDLFLYNRWKKLLPEAVVVPQFKVLFRQAQDRLIYHQSLLSVNLLHDKAEILLFLDGKFQFYNIFEIKGADDIDYYMLQINQQFGIVSLIEQVMIAGIDEDHDYSKRLSAYGSTLTFV